MKLDIRPVMMGEQLFHEITHRHTDEAQVYCFVPRQWQGSVWTLYTAAPFAHKDK